MRKRLIILFFLSMAFFADAQIRTLKECIMLGIANNRSVLNAQIDVKKGRTAVSQNRSRLLPVINGVFQFSDFLKQPVNVTTGTLLGNDFPDEPTWQTIRSMQYNVSAGVQLNMPLYNQSIYEALDVAKAVERLGEISYDKAVEDLTVQIGKVYFLDLSPETPLEVETMADEIELSDFSGISCMLPDLQMAVIQKEIAERKISVVRAGYIPTLSLTGYAGALCYQDRFSHFFHTRNASGNWFGNCFIGFNISIPIFDANSKRLQISRHRHDAEQASNRAEQLRNRISQEYSDAMRQLSHNIEVFRTQSQNYRQALDVYNVTEEQYKEGVSSMTAILQDEMQLRTAQSACVQAVCQFNIARIDLLRLSGNLSELTD